jgi:hypothetical protein
MEEDANERQRDPFIILYHISSPNRNKMERRNNIQQSDIGREGMPVVESLSIRPLSGDALLPGCPVMLEVVCHSPGAFDAVGWTVEIGRGEMRSIATLIGGHGDHRYALVPGRNVLRGRIERLPLAPGNYELRTSIVELTSNAILAGRGYFTAPVLFEVAHSADRASQMMVYRNNIVCIPVDWC